MEADDGNTALHCAARTGQSIAVKFPLEYGAHVDVWNSKYRTPLFEAAVGGNSETILTLLQAGETVHRFERPSWKTGSAPAFVDHIVAIGQPDLVQAILNMITPKLEKSREAKAIAFAIAAAKIGQTSILASLSVSDPKVFIPYMRLRPIAFAVSNGHLETVCMLIVPTDLSETSLFLPELVRRAAKRGHLNILQHLLESFPGALSLFHSECQSHLQLASANGHLDSVRYLLSRSDIDSNRTLGYDRISALQVAVIGRHLEVVQILLLSPGIDAAQKSGQGTALFLAAKSGSLEVTRALSEHGARDETALFPTFWTGLHLARLIFQYTMQSSSQVVEEAIKSRAQLADILLRVKGYRYHEVSHDSDHLISLAVKENDVGLLQVLLSLEYLTTADLDEKIRRYIWHAYRTPLNNARQRGYTEAADPLSAHGATDEVWDPYGRLAVDEKKEDKRAAAAKAAAKENESLQPALNQAKSTPAASRDTSEVASQEEDDSDGDDAGSELGEEPWSYINEYVSPQSNEVDASERQRKRQRQG